MAAPAAATRPVATLTLDLALTKGGVDAMPRQDLVTGVKHHDNALRKLRTQLDEAARDAFESEGFALDDLRFRRPQLGRLTAILSVATKAERLETGRFAAGVAGLSDASRRPLEAFLREVHDSSVDVAVTKSFVERAEPGPPAEEPPPALTRDEQRLARWICGVAFVAIALFVIVVLTVT